MSEQYTNDEPVVHFNVHFEVERRVLTYWTENFRVPKVTLDAVMHVLGEDAAADDIRSALRRMGHEPTIYGHPIEESDFIDNIDDEYVTINVRKVSDYYDV